MTLLLTAPQCFFLVVLAFAVIGFMRGWRRELVSLGFSLAAVLFLYLGGANGLADFIFLRVPVIASLVAGSSSRPSVSSATASDVFIVTVATLIIVVGVGYLVGNKAFPKPKQPAERLLGILPAIVSGYFLMLYVTNVLAKTSLITFGVNTPSAGVVGNYMLIIFVIAVVVILAALIATSATKKSSSPPGGKH